MRRKISRRDFMKGTAVVVASGILAGCSNGEMPAPSSSTSSEVMSSTSSSSSEPETSSSETTSSSSEQEASSSTEEASSSSEAEKKTSPWTYSIYETSKKTAILTGYDSSHPDAPNGVFTLPGEVDGYKIVKIGNSAFKGDLNITALEISDSVQEIGSSAFEGCENITTLKLSNSLKSIGSSAFQGCKKLAGTLVIPASVKTVEAYAFLNCKSLKKIVMLENETESGVSRIDYAAFSHCINVENVKFASGLTYIESRGFNTCESLNNLVIPENRDGKEITIIHCSFEGCTALVRVYIPCCVKKIDSPFTFPCCDKEIYYQGTEEEWNQLGIKSKMDIIGDGSKNVVVHYNAKPSDVSVE